MNKVALITGGTRGIGLGIAQALAGEGFDLALCGVRELSAVEDTVEQIGDLGVQVWYGACDIGDREARQRLLAGVRKRFGRLHLLVNNAGVAPRERRDILTASEESFEWVLKTNLQGPYFLTQAVAGWMIEQRQAEGSSWPGGTVVNVSSISATVASLNRGEYCVSKAGLNMATRLWAARLGEYSIPVYEVRPGIIATDMTAGVKEKYDRLLEDGLCVQSRWGLPADVGRAVAMLARGDLAYSSGQVVMVDGGLTLPRL